MKKLLLSFALVVAFASTQAQNLYNYGFSGVSADLTTAGWVRTNQSTLADATRLWSIASYTAVTATSTFQNPFNAAPVAVGATSPVPNGQAGGGNSFALVNFAGTTSTAATGATLSNWLISPSITVENGDIVTFYTRIGKNTTANNASFADRLQLRMSTNGAFTAVPSTGPEDIGDFSEVLVDVNPTLNLTAYPSTWTQYSYTVAGLTGPTDCLFAFRYYVTDGGPQGNNSDIIGIDTFSVDRALSTDSFFRNNFGVAPNPANDVIYISNITDIAVNSIQLADINGRTVKEVKGMTNQINVAELNAGVYFLKITTDQGTGTTKVIKR
ncbi:T9SS type A sorting domain-containing protein [Flavobacterium sp. CYK-4]|uniref:T9SS-dependent choice-of-anchor J family protein n=1 Tax=Flavobacterium lotistagni TaxID=2709660 RepID=UPI00140E4A5E|nr:choice-of-anchor J domain-containing protein [Flavobacterium lotistagni]NHM08117.1 T9SS type A sorting domain-containing protein [Flavobacterium lotistagni]